MEQRLKPWVKVCGNTRLEDCLHAAACGADAVGFIFAPGKRTVTSQQAALIVHQLPASLETIGVFTETVTKDMLHASRQAGVSGIQLHTRYDPSAVDMLREDPDGRTLMLIQVVLWDLTGGVEEQSSALHALYEQIASDGLLDRILIDSHTPQGSGGTGQAFPWAAARSAIARDALPIIIAGGLRPENVAVAVQTLQPFGVDVSSGVEHQPGVKDAEAVQAFIQHARAASASPSSSGG